MYIIETLLVSFMYVRVFKPESRIFLLIFYADRCYFFFFCWKTTQEKSVNSVTGYGPVRVRNNLARLREKKPPKLRGRWS